MMSASNKEILVYADWQALNGPHLMGRLFVTRARGKSVAKHFRLNDSNAAEIIKKAHTAVALWKSIAKNYKLSEFETDLMAPAFLPDTTRRRTWRT